MNIHLFSLVIAVTLTLVASLRIFPLENQPAPPPKKNIYSGYAIEDRKKYSGLTGGLLPGSLQTTTQPGQDGTVPGNGDYDLARDLLPPKAQDGFTTLNYFNFN